VLVELVVHSYLLGGLAAIKINVSFISCTPPSMCHAGCMSAYVRYATALLDEAYRSQKQLWPDNHGGEHVCMCGVPGCDPLSLSPASPPCL